jgi:archaellin
MKLSHLVLSILLIQSYLTGTIVFQERVFAQNKSQAVLKAAESRASGSITLTTETIRWNYAKKSEEFPARETIVRYPVVTGLKNTVVLRRVQTAIGLKNIVGQSLKELQEDERPWLTDFGYTVNYNQDNILDLSYTISGIGAYPTNDIRRVSIDLRTGRILQVKDLFRLDTSGALTETIEAMMQQEIQSKIVELQKVAPDLKPDIFAKYHFGSKDLHDFTISKEGVTFNYAFGFPHAIKAAEPTGYYFLSYDKLSPYIRLDGAIGFILGRSKK